MRLFETGNNNISNTAAYATLSAITYAGQAGYKANSLGNPDLGWEKTKSTDHPADTAGKTPHLLLVPKIEHPSYRKLPENMYLSL